MKTFRFYFISLAGVIVILFPEAGLGRSWETLLKTFEDKRFSSNIQSIDFIYMINLDERPFRLEKSIQALKPFHIVPYRVSAVNGRAISPQVLKECSIKLPARGEKTEGTALTKGGLGCCLSHLSVIKDALLSGYKTIWVMEDDIKILKNPNELDNIISKLDDAMPDWDILYTDVPHFQHQRSDGDFYMIPARFGTYSLIIRQSGLKKIWDYFLHYGIRYPIDNELNCVPGLVKVNLNHNLISFLTCWSSDTQEDPTR